MALPFFLNIEIDMRVLRFLIVKKNMQIVTLRFHCYSHVVHVVKLIYFAIPFEI